MKKRKGKRAIPARPRPKALDLQIAFPDTAVQQQLDDYCAAVKAEWVPYLRACAEEAGIDSSAPGWLWSRFGEPAMQSQLNLSRHRRGRYYVLHDSQWQGSLPHAESISEQDAARWLLTNEHELPEDLVKFAEEVSE